MKIGLNIMVDDIPFSFYDNQITGKVRKNGQLGQGCYVLLMQQIQNRKEGRIVHIHSRLFQHAKYNCESERVC